MLLLINTINEIQERQGRTLRLVFPFPFQISVGITVLLVELINTTLRSCSLLGAGVERMAPGAYFDVDLRLRRAGHEGIAAVAGHGCLKILGVNSLFHSFLLFLLT